MSLTMVLTRMLQSGLFYPSSEWVVPYKGQGMDAVRAEIAFKVMHNPAQATMQDVQKIFCKESHIF